MVVRGPTRQIRRRRTLADLCPTDPRRLFAYSAGISVCLSTVRLTALPSEVGLQRRISFPVKTCGWKETAPGV